MNTPPDTTPDLNLLLAQHLTSAREMAFARVTPDLHLADCSDSLDHFIEAGGPQPEGQPLEDVFWEFVGSDAALRDVLEGTQPFFAIEHVGRETGDGDNGRVYITFRVEPLNPGSPGDGLLLIVRDSTEAGALEQRMVQERNELRLTRAQLQLANAELQRVNRLKSLFLSMAAHDLRTPLSVINGFAALLRDTPGAERNPTELEFLNTIIDQGEWLDRLIGDMLALNQIESGRLELTPTSLDLNQLARHVYTLMQTSADMANLTFDLILPDTATIAYVDNDRVQQVVFNLVGNAIKYTPRGGHIVVSVLEGDNMAGIRVSDNGRGLTPEEQDQLFTLYYRTEEAKHSKKRGTGLGLYIVKMFMEAHNGRVDVTSSPGAGTTFTIWLPRTEAAFLGS